MAKVPVSTPEELAYQKAYYEQNKASLLKRKKEIRDILRAKRLDNIANGRPKEEGIAELKIRLNSRIMNKKKKEKRANDRVYQSERRAKKQAEREKEILERYKKNFSGE